jgi:hypothetical protein
MQTNKGKSVSEFEKNEYISNNEHRVLVDRYSHLRRRGIPILFARGPLALWLISAMDARGHYE